MTLIHQVNRSLPAIEETCACESESWRCGSVSGKPPYLMLSVENTTDEVLHIIHIVITCSVSLQLNATHTTHGTQNNAHNSHNLYNSMQITQYVRAYPHSKMFLFARFSNCLRASAQPAGSLIPTMPSLNRGPKYKRDMKKYDIFQVWRLEGGLGE